jgi:LPS sulfotransferase NodH
MRFLLATYLSDAPLASAEELAEKVPDFHRLIVTGSMAPRGQVGPVIMRTHFLPSKDIMRHHGPMTGKVLYLVRNPRDVLLSYARGRRIHAAEDERSRMWAKSFIESRGDPSAIGAIGTWPQNVREWTSLEEAREYYPNADLLTVRYEDLKADPVAKLAEIVEFLNLDAPGSQERLQRATENSSQAKMRALEETTRPGGQQAREFPWVGKGMSNQSLTGFGDDIEVAYKQLLEDDEEFSRCAKQFGYDR